MCCRSAVEQQSTGHMHGLWTWRGRAGEEEERARGKKEIMAIMRVRVETTMEWKCPAVRCAALGPRLPHLANGVGLPPGRLASSSSSLPLPARALAALVAGRICCALFVPG